LENLSTLLIFNFYENGKGAWYFGIGSAPLVEVIITGAFPLGFFLLIFIKILLCFLSLIMLRYIFDIPEQFFTNYKQKIAGLAVK
jgi:hypothetical protein